MGLLHRITARHAARIWETETHLLHAMRLVRRPVAAQWLVTSACDLSCPHCYTRAGKRMAGELSTEEARERVVDELVAMGVPLLVLAGGELLLRRDIPELVDYARSRGLEWAMHTHGLHVPRFAELLRRHPPALAAISLDGDRPLHDGFRGRAGSFDGALAAIRVLKEAGCREVVAGTTITRRSADTLADLFPIVAASGADSWGLHLFAPEGRGAEHEALFPTDEQLARVAAFGRRMRRLFHVELCNEWGSAGADDVRYRDQPFLCGAGRISFVVSAGGEVLPCTTTDLSESEGNVRSERLRDIWARGFGRFRATGHGACSDGRRCWLQARNGRDPGTAAFGAVAASGERSLVRWPALGRRASTSTSTPRPLQAGARIAGAGALGAGARLAGAGTLGAGARLAGAGALGAGARLVGPLGARAARAAAAMAVLLEACVPPAPIDQAPAGSGSRAPAASEAASSAVAPTSSVAPLATEPLATASGSESAPPPPVAPPAVAVGAFPPLDAAAVARHFSLRRPHGPWQKLWLSLAGARLLSLRDLRELALAVGDTAGVRLSNALVAHVDRLTDGRADTSDELVEMLDAAEAHPVFDAAFAAYLWQRSADLPTAGRGASSDALFARIARHRQIALALEAASRSGAVSYRAWLSKAAPPPGWRDEPVVAKNVLPDARSAFVNTPPAVWTVGATTLTVTAGEVVVKRPGSASVTVTAGASFGLFPLDVVHAAANAELAHALVGVIRLPGGSVGTLLTLDRLLDAAGRAELGALVSAANAGDLAAHVAVEARLPFAVRHMRAAVAHTPDAPGAPHLRELLLRLWAPA